MTSPLSLCHPSRLLDLATIVLLLAGPAAEPGAAPAPASPSSVVPGNPARPGKLVLPERVHDAGRVERGTVIEHSFAVRNEGAGPLLIDAKPGCGCTLVEFDKRIPSGGVGHVRARLDTRMFQGDITKSVTLDTNDPEQAQAVLEMVAFIVVAVEVQPQEIVSVEGRRGEVPPVELTLSSPEGVVFDVLSAESNDPSYSVAVAAAPVESPAQAEGRPGARAKKRAAAKDGVLASGASRYAVTVSVAKDVAIGRSGVQVLVKTSHPKAPEINIQIYPNILGDIEAVPERVTLRLSPASPAEIRTEHVAVRRTHGELPFEVTGVSSSNALIKASFKPVTAGSEYDVAITYDGPPLTNVVDAHVSIMTSHPDQPLLTVVVYAFPEPEPAAMPAVPAEAGAPATQQPPTR